VAGTKVEITQSLYSFYLIGDGNAFVLDTGMWLSLFREALCGDANRPEMDGSGGRMVWFLDLRCLPV
jgi:hypothetical protein